MSESIRPIIIVHGGAGNWSAEGGRLERAMTDCRAAAASGQAILLRGGSALDAVEAAVQLLEDSPVLDAGRGSYLNLAAEIEMDAIIMDGASLDFGAVAAVQRVRHPVSLARRVMTDTPHAFLAAAGAEAFADAIAFPRCELSDLLAGDEIEALRNWGREGAKRAPSPLSTTAIGDTVGAVALDAAGNLAAATSTGGTRRKMAGRVGDSPVVGAGAYADNASAAVSATGHGEGLMKVVISKIVCDLVAAGQSAQAACDQAIHTLAERVHGHGGLIAVDAAGGIGIAHNTAGMPHAIAAGDARASAWAGRAEG
ncbi:MAG: isoaspartyl peptidase/L-asparaginase family protein [Candidatus Promineifilaceae bacterium]